MNREVEGCFSVIVGVPMMICIVTCVLEIIPMMVIEKIFNVDVPRLDGTIQIIFSVILSVSYWILLIKYVGDENNKHPFKTFLTITLTPMILFGIIFFNISKPKNLTQNNYSSSYHSSSGNYSNSSYRHSEHSSYTPPIERNSSDENKISVNPPKVSEEIKIQEQQTEEKISEEPKNQNLISEEKSDENFTPQENKKNDSPDDKKTFPSYSKYTSDEWEYIMSDENGNDYYISKYYSVNIFDNPYEGKTFSAEFKKVFSNGGYEVDIPAFDKNYRRITEKKILSSEEKIIHFRNENGFKEFKISVITGYDENDSVIVGYGSTQMKDFMKWKSVNNSLYNELYEAAYSRLK